MKVILIMTMMMILMSHKLHFLGMLWIGLDSDFCQIFLH